MRTHDEQKSHAEFLQPAIREMLESTGIKASGLDAVAVVSGPGSYTGLRVGMASAKGLCFALNKPLITVNSLELLAHAVKSRFLATGRDIPDFICPMIDARRMEVFTAVYDSELVEQKRPFSLILDQQSYQDQLSSGTVCFAGNGSLKWQSICKAPAAQFEDVTDLSSSFCSISYQRFLRKDFADLVLSDPFYVKDFYSPAQ